MLSRRDYHVIAERLRRYASLLCNLNRAFREEQRTLRESVWRGPRLLHAVQDHNETAIEIITSRGHSWSDRHKKRRHCPHPVFIR